MRPTTLTLFDPAFLADVPVSGTITPNSFGFPLRWWDAKSLDYLIDGATILPSDSWDDQSPNGMNANTTISHEPIFKSASVAGKPAVRLQGTKRLVFNGGQLSLGDFTILCVGVSINDSIFLSKNAVNRQIRINRSGEHRASWNAESGQEVVSNLFVSNAANPRMFGYRRDAYSTASRDVRFFDNAAVIDRPVQTISADIFNLDQIGIIDGGPLNIDIAELVIYDKALTNGEILSLYTEYFKPKFSLP